MDDENGSDLSQKSNFDNEIEVEVLHTSHNSQNDHISLNSNSFVENYQNDLFQQKIEN